MKGIEPQGKPWTRAAKRPIPPQGAENRDLSIPALAQERVHLDGPLRSLRLGMDTVFSGIGSLNEKTLHRQLKDLYLKTGCVQEYPVGSYYIDIRSPDKLVEIQTGSFSSLKKKLSYLLEENRVLLVYPLTAEKYISTMEADGQTVRSRRKSPKKQDFSHAAGQLIYICGFLEHPNFECEVLLTEEEEIRIDDGKGSWRRKGISLSDRILIKIRDRKLFSYPEDYLSLLPNALPEKFTNSDIYKKASCTKRIAGQLSYLLKKLGLIECVEKKGNSQVFTIKDPVTAQQSE